MQNSGLVPEPQKLRNTLKKLAERSKRRVNTQSISLHLRPQKSGRICSNFLSTHFPDVESDNGQPADISLYLDIISRATEQHFDAAQRDVRQMVEAAIDEVAKRAGPVAEDTWRALDGVIQELPGQIGGTAEDVKTWMEEHPAAAAALITSILLPPVTAAAAVPLLQAAGFGAGGVVGGSAAAGLQSGLGNIPAGSLFSVLQSAGAGGFGANIVGGSVWAATSVAAWAATIPQHTEAAVEDKCEKEDPQNQYRNMGSGEQGN